MVPMEKKTSDVTLSKTLASDVAKLDTKVAALAIRIATFSTSLHGGMHDEEIDAAKAELVKIAEDVKNLLTD